MEKKNNPTKKKVGQFSTKELDFLNKNIETMTAEQMAEHLNRSLEVVEKHLESIRDNENTTLNRLESKRAFQDLQKKPYWAELKLQYTPKELELYLYHWAKYLEQFNFDVTHSEESQICKAIDLQILMGRTLKEKQKVDGEIEIMEKELRRAVNEDDTVMTDDAKNNHRNYIQSIMTQLAGVRSSQLNRTKEFKDLVDQHQKLTKDLKGTRDQRFKEIEDRKVTFFGWLKQFDNINERMKLSREAELIAMASEKSLQDLGEYHTYQDNSVDQCILNAETVKEDNNG